MRADPVEQKTDSSLRDVVLRICLWLILTGGFAVLCIFLPWAAING